MSTVVQDMQTILPSLAPPSGNKFVHIASEPGKMPAYCGWSGTPKHMDCGLLEQAHAARCNCGTPLCPTCLAIRQSWINSGGAWEGA